MKKLLVLLLFIPIVSIGQKKQKGIIWDSEMLHYKSVDEIIDYNSKMNFTLVSKMFDYGNSTEVVYQNPKDSDYYMNNISYHFIKSNEKSYCYKIEQEIKFFDFSNLSSVKILENLRTNYLNRFNSISKNYKTINFIEKNGVDYEKISKTKYFHNTINGSEAELYFRYGFGIKDYNNIDVGRLKTIFISTSVSFFEDSLNSLDKTKKTITKSYNNLRFTIGGKNIRESNIYDLKSMVNIFLEDCKKNNITTPLISTLKATFEPLDGNTIALSYGLDNDSAIIIKVDPEKWKKSSIQKKWYILYHELGHDVLNLEHGQGGKMMYNFADRNYSWNEFFEDKKYMINSIK